VKKLGSLVLLCALTTAGCYHATINTGRQPSGQTIEVPWAHSFLYGLVPPSTVETAQQCPNGVATVETQHSFLNGLASFLTFALYTPITIEVQCAASDDDADASAVLPRGEDESTRELLTRAVDRAHQTGERVTVDLR
jgi:Bor protein